MERVLKRLRHAVAKRPNLVPFSPEVGLKRQRFSGWIVYGFKSLQPLACRPAGMMDSLHPLQALKPAATNALDWGADLGKLQEWLGPANVSTTRLYSRRRSRPEDGPTWMLPLGVLLLAQNLTFLSKPTRRAPGLAGAPLGQTEGISWLLRVRSRVLKQ